MKRIKTILLVDDDQVSNYISERLLKKLGVADEITVVTNGEQGVNCLEDTCFKTKMSPELILLDINMPVMDGFEFLRTYNRLDFKNKHEVVIAVLSSSSNDFDKEKVSQLGIRHYIDKPLTEAKVRNLLAHLERKAPSAF